jgi:hypothetical protein
MMPSQVFILSNVAEGTHPNGNLTYTASTAISSKYLFGAQTTTARQIALAGSGNTSTGTRAIGVVTDEADSAADPVNVQILGSSGSTMKALAGGTIAIGSTITSDSSSMAVAVSAQSAGTYYVYGIALNAAAAGDYVEFTPVVGVTQTVS